MYRLLFRMVLLRISAEHAHSLAGLVLRLLAVRPLRDVVWACTHRRERVLRVEAMGLSFSSPLGAAAGIDKDARWFLGLSTIGFGFVETGTVTVAPQTGTSGKRVWRLPTDRGLINAMGFPNPGAAIVAARLRARPPKTIVGVNVGRSLNADNAISDYCEAIRQLAPVADYLVLNVSSPNTPGLRRLQNATELTALVCSVQEALNELDERPPLLIKIAPDLTDDQVLAIADLSLELGLDGVVAVNTTTSRTGLSSPEPSDVAGRGGISGGPLSERAIEVLQLLRSRVGEGLTIVSAGGIEDADDAWQRIRAGATLLQAYTGFVYGGPAWASRIGRGLAEKVHEAGGCSVQDFVGVGEID